MGYSIANVGVLSHGSTSISAQLLEQWQNSNQPESINFQNQKDQLKTIESQEQQPAQAKLTQLGSSAESQQQPRSCSEGHTQVMVDQGDDHPQKQAEQNHLQLSQKSTSSMSESSSVSFSESERMQHSENKPHSKLQRMDNQQASATEPVNSPMTRGKQIPFGMLLPAIIPHIDKDRAMQLNTLYNKLKTNEISKENFVRLMRGIIGDQMLRQALSKIHNQARTSQSSACPELASKTKPKSVQIDTSIHSTENSSRNFIETDNQSDSRGQSSSSSMTTAIQETDASSVHLQGASRQQQQQHVRLPQSSFSMYGGTFSNHHPHEYSGALVGSSSLAAPMKSQTQDSQMRQVSLRQGMVSTQSGGATQPMNLMNMPKYDMQNSMSEPKRFSSGSLSHLPSHSMTQHTPVPWQSSLNKEQKSSLTPSMPYVKQEFSDQIQEQHHKPQLPVSVGSSAFSIKQDDQGNMTPSVSATLSAQLDPTMRTIVPSAPPSLIAGNNMRMPPKKPSVGQKKPPAVLGVQAQIASKKQKVTGAFLDQSIDQLNDVTAVSGVNLREEEEQLLSGPKDENRASEATRRVVQEEEERLILQKIPLQKKLAKIMSNCDIKNVSNDVERCLSLCVEERMRGLISNLIKLSKQRADIERLRHQVLVNSDVQHGISMINQKAKDEWERKQADEAEKSRKLNEADGSAGVDGGKDKDEGRLKTLKANKEEDDKMRTTAANVAARVAVGGDDMLSKWQLMAEQARQKREGGTDVASSTPLGKDLGHKTLSTSGTSTRDNQDSESRGLPTAVAAAAATALSAKLKCLPLLLLGSVRKFGRKQVVWPPAKTTRTISVKDLIAVLQRDPHMLRSTLIDRLYEKMNANGAAE
ncbi:hypothetical protein Sjap_022698 [Stephania japonica]|uniref:RST domain-containing protein n=1 Tax=Stephania japonica TaxID=461633 RepID=A0AAP0HUM7_9MAGN